MNRKFKAIILGIGDAFLKNNYLFTIPLMAVVRPRIMRKLTQVEEAEVLGGKMNRFFLYRRIKGKPIRITNGDLPVGHIGGISNIPKVEEPQAVRFVIQEHHARRAGLHYDLRIHINGKAYSWAIRKPLPKGYGLHGLYRQPDHSESYSDWEGTIEDGYGAGLVRKFDEGMAVIQSENLSGKQTGLRVRFYGLKTQGDYSMFPQSGTDWGILKHHDLDKFGTVEANEYTTKVPPEVWDDPRYIKEVKLDGANFTCRIGKKGNSFSSRRLSVDNKSIYKSDNVPHLRDLKIPKKWNGTVVQGELAVEKNVNGIPVCSYEDVSGILNSRPWKAIQSQQRLGKIKYHPFEVIKSPLLRRSATYAERRDLLLEMERDINSPYFKVPKGVTTGGRGFYERVINSKAVFNGGSASVKKVGEGVVIKNLAGDRRSMPFKWLKQKTSQSFDLKIVGFTTGSGRLKGKGVGTFILEDKTGRQCGEVGSGLTDEVRFDAYRHPEKYMNQVVEIRAFGSTPAGMLRGLSLVRFRQDKDPRLLDSIEVLRVGANNRTIESDEQLMKRYIAAENPEVAGDSGKLQELVYRFKSSRGWKAKK